jgi:hypothetical protein
LLARCLPDIAGGPLASEEDKKQQAAAPRLHKRALKSLKLAYVGFKRYVAVLPKKAVSFDTEVHVQLIEARTVSSSRMFVIVKFQLTCFAAAEPRCFVCRPLPLRVTSRLRALTALAGHGCALAAASSFRCWRWFLAGRAASLCAALCRRPHGHEQRCRVRLCRAFARVCTAQLVSRGCCGQVAVIPFACRLLAGRRCRRGAWLCLLRFARSSC